MGKMPDIDVGIMNLVVLPLSVGRPRFLPPVVTNGLLIHMFGVGLPSSLFARAADSDADIPGFRGAGGVRMREF